MSTLAAYLDFEGNIPDASLEIPNAIGWYIEVFNGEYEYAAEFKIFEVTNGGEEEDLMFEGHVKWDHCTNFSIANEYGMVHICEPEDLLHIKNVFSRVHELAAKILEGKWLTY